MTKQSKLYEHLIDCECGHTVPEEFAVMEQDEFIFNCMPCYIKYLEGEVKEESISTVDGARSYLERQGINVDDLVSEGMHFIEAVKAKVALKNTIPIEDITDLDCLEIYEILDPDASMMVQSKVDWVRGYLITNTNSTFKASLAAIRRLEAKGYNLTQITDEQ